MWAINTYLPLLAQGALNYSPVGSGLILTPFGISTFVFGTALGRLITRTGRFRWQMFLGPVVSLVGFVLLTRHVTRFPTQAEIVRNLVICGFGLALGNATRIAVQNAMPQQMMGVVMARHPVRPRDRRHRDADRARRRDDLERARRARQAAAGRLARCAASTPMR